MKSEVVILKEGYIEVLGDGRLRADATISLIKGPRNIVVDTGNPASGQALSAALGDMRLAPGDIDFVVCTHGHTDHTGNNGLFPHATFIVGRDISKGDIFRTHDFESRPLKLCEYVEVIPTAGHTKYDVSVKVETAEGLVYIVGDLIFTRPGRAGDELWCSFAEFPETQAANRRAALARADYIVPGHAGIFKVSGQC